LAILDEDETPDALLANYGNAARFESWLLRTRQYWADKLDALQFHTGDDRFNGWLRWVTLQPSLRRLCGNSYLPYHDYGHGGRGWRDLWQDLLALLMIEPVDVRPLLYSNFAGVRVDGSNATIIGSSPGDFRADRNNIPRVWMDHGAWPLQTTQLYIDYTGDLSFLLRDQVYFKDSWLRRAQTFDETWRPEDGSEHRTAAGDVYQGTILEHLLIQHLTAFFNVGEHNIIKLEGADWNDGLDMAQERGESVAFTALYAGNLKQLSKLAMQLTELGITEIFLAVDLKQLLDTFGDPVDYTSPSEKQQRLAEYFTAVQPSLSGEKMSVTLRDLAADLATKANWLSHHLQRQEWIDNEAGFSWFNGYYDDDGYRVEGDHPDGVRMTLTGQTFALMGDITTHDQAAEIVRAVDHYLYDAAVGGYRLNTDFGEVSLNLGRCFGFAFGHKENGAMFSHMAVMYANALYRRGLVREGNKVLVELYSHSQNFAVSRMYPGIPEYVNARGRGMYPYLTGSASWFLLTFLAEVFGIKGQLGDLLLQPKLLREQFDVAGKATVVTQFADRKLRIIYNNPAGLDHGDYHIAGVKVNGEVASFNKSSDGVIIDRSVISSLNLGPIHDMDVMLKADVN
jgi:cellobiose phosphorylase